VRNWIIELRSSKNQNTERLNAAPDLRIQLFNNNPNTQRILMENKNHSSQ
jgi:hypothetical protein